MSLTMVSSEETTCALAYDELWLMIGLPMFLRWWECFLLSLYNALVTWVGGSLFPKVMTCLREIFT